MVVNVPVPLPTETDVALANTSVVPILNPLADTVAFPFELIVADTVNVAAVLEVDSVDVNDKSENNGTVVLNPPVAA